VKPGPVIAMIALLCVGLWLAATPAIRLALRTTDGATPFEVVIGSKRVAVERFANDQPRPSTVPSGDIYRFINLHAAPGAWLNPEQFNQALEDELAASSRRPAILRYANTTSWAGILWVLIGLAGQVLFFGRMLIQWVISEKARQSTISPAFWWCSFFGGAMLFTYFAWRQDPIGVLGQSTGVVIYARNLRLIYKQRRREARKLAEPEAPVGA